MIALKIITENCCEKSDKKEKRQWYRNMMLEAKISVCGRSVVGVCVCVSHQATVISRMVMQLFVLRTSMSIIQHIRTIKK